MLKVKLTKMYSPARRKEGFAGQHVVVLPESVRRRMEKEVLTTELFPVASGYFPTAPGHYVDRSSGLAEFILIVCISGRGWVCLGGETWTIEPGDAVGILPGVPHRYGAEDGKPWSIMWVHCRGRELLRYTELLGVSASAPLVHLLPGTLDQIEFAEIYRPLERGHTFLNLLRATVRLRVVVAEIAAARRPANFRARPAEEMLQGSIDWMHVHPDRKITLDGLARRAGLSVPHYSMLFRRKMGYSPLNYFQRIKIQRACQLLDTTALAISEIGAAVGFDDPYHFSRAFKKIMGRCPRAFRKITKG